MPNAFGTTKYSFNRPALHAAYSNNDLVANTATAEDVVPLKFSTSRFSGKGKILAATMFKNAANATNASFLLYLFKQDPEVAVGDADAFALPSARQLIGTIAMDMTTGGTAGTADLKKRFALTVPIYFDLEHVGPHDRTIYGLLQVLAAYDPIADELIEIELECEGWSR